MKLYKNDGLILSPIDGSREIKIKPNKLLSIDLLYKNKWIDRENNDWSHLIINNDNNYKINNIYRCYPEVNKKFSVRECRYDKKTPNTFNIINTIINILNYNWLNEVIFTPSLFDFKKPLLPTIIIKTLETQLKLLEDSISGLKPETNKKWLDLGCGKGKIIPIIKKYNPKNYLGLDNDIKRLLKCLIYHDKDQQVYNFNPCDLNKWDHEIKWYTNNNKYDYVIANFSIMYFFTDQFWSGLDNIVNIGTKFLFNIVSPTNKNEWYENKSFMSIKGSVVVTLFEWSNDYIIYEPYITEEMVNVFLKKYNWKILNRFKMESKYELVNFYTWFIIEKY
jgi:hypothetical protein